MSKPIVAIVGRPNVGKSTLFNRVVGRRLAIVEEMPGTTRDRIYADAVWGDTPFVLVDTGGLEVGAPEVTPLMEAVRAQAEMAIAEADAILFMVDVRDGLLPQDEEVAHILRRFSKPLFLVVNKADNRALAQAAVEFYRLGLGEPYPISALHGRGVADLLDRVVEALPKAEEEPPTEAVRIAIVGRVNVGKSSLLNALLGQERAIVSEIPGTTRDALDTFMEWEGKPVVLIDTAGIRRRGRIRPGVERYSVLRALRAIGRADVVLLLLDATEGVTAQDAHIAGYVLEEAKGVVIVVNKWDLLRATHPIPEYAAYVRGQLHFIDYAPVLFISAKTGWQVEQVLPTALRVREERMTRISTGELNRLMEEVLARHAPPSKAGKRLKFYYATQAGINPPTFVFFVNDPDLVHFSYQRYLENRLRERYGFLGTPLRLIFRRRRKR